MGQDLVSYALAMPDDKKVTAKLIKDEATRIEKVLRKIGDRPTMAALKQTGVSIWDYLNDTGGWEEPEGDDMSDGAMEIVDAVRREIHEDLKLVKGLHSDCDFGRDSGWWGGKVRGRKVKVIYAGEMSWGDTPEGAGFLTLRALVRLGIGNKLEDLLE